MVNFALFLAFSAASCSVFSTKYRSRANPSASLSVSQKGYNFLYWLCEKTHDAFPPSTFSGNRFLTNFLMFSAHCFQEAFSLSFEKGGSVSRPNERGRSFILSCNDKAFAHLTASDPTVPIVSRCWWSLSRSCFSSSVADGWMMMARPSMQPSAGTAAQTGSIQTNRPHNTCNQAELLLEAYITSPASRLVTRDELLPHLRERTGSRNASNAVVIFNAYRRIRAELRVDTMRAKATGW